jgi:hypothetical protein
MKLLLTGVVAAIFPCVIFSQTINTYSLTNTSGIYGVLSNPANAAASTDWLSINAFGAGLGMENNVVHTRLDYSVSQILLLKHRVDDKPYYTKPFFEVKKYQPKKPTFYANVQLLLPSIKININQKFSVFLYLQERIIGNVVNIGNDVLPLLIAKEVPTGDNDLSFNTNVRALAYHETAVGFGLVLFNRREGMLKIGATVKKLNARFAYIVSTQYFTSEHAFDRINLTSRYRVLTTDIQKLTASPTGYATGSSNAGQGYSANFGFVYEHRPYALKHRYRVTNPKGKNKNFRQRNNILYDYKIGASLLDWGSITINNKHVTDKIYESKTSINSSQPPPPEDYVKEITKNSEVVSQQNKTLLYMPATLLLNFDYHINHSWFFNIAYSQNLMSNKKTENFYNPTSICVMTRKETEKITYCIPLRVVPLTRTATIGWLTTIGPFFIGTDNIATFLRRKMYNWSVYTGFCFTINYKKDPTIETFKNFNKF